MFISATKKSHNRRLITSLEIHRKREIHTYVFNRSGIGGRLDYDVADDTFHTNATIQHKCDALLSRSSLNFRTIEQLWIQSSRSRDFLEYRDNTNV